MKNQILPLLYRSVASSSHRNILRHDSGVIKTFSPRFLSSLSRVSWNKDDGPILDFPDMGPPIPEQKQRPNESIEQKRARLFYQSRYNCSSAIYFLCIEDYIE